MCNTNVRIIYSSCLSRNLLLVLLYASIISAICNVVDLIVSSFQFIGIELAQSACQPDEPVSHLFQCCTCEVCKHLHVLLDGKRFVIPKDVSMLASTTAEARIGEILNGFYAELQSLVKAVDIFP